MQTINLQNGNNVNMLNFELYLYQGSPGPFPTPRPMCIKVDDATAATANNPPYDSWIIHDIDPTFYDTGVCTLSTTNVEALAVALYPNPVSEVFRINSQQDIKRINIYDLQGKLVKSYAKPQGNYPVADLAKGMYFVEVQSIENQKQLLKLVKK